MTPLSARLARAALDLSQALLCALVCVYVAVEAAYYVGRRARASLARLSASGVIGGTPAVQAPQALRRALLRFLARFYAWGLA